MHLHAAMHKTRRATCRQAALCRVHCNWYVNFIVRQNKYVLRDQIAVDEKRQPGAQMPVRIADTQHKRNVRARMARPRFDAAQLKSKQHVMGAVHADHTDRADQKCEKIAKRQLIVDRREQHGQQHQAEQKAGLGRHDVNAPAMQFDRTGFRCVAPQYPVLDAGIQALHKDC
jgi:hypothetical protein